MHQPGLPPLVGRRDGELKLFFVTQKANFGSEVSGFIRDYPPLGAVGVLDSNVARK